MIIEPVCRVCGTALGGDGLVTCERCETAHHRDCWEYWGRCALYGCSGLVRPESEAVVVPPFATGLEVREGGPDRYLPPGPLVDSHRVLLYSRAGAHIRLGPKEVAVQLPPAALPELPLSLARNPRLSPIVAGLASVVVLLLVVALALVLAVGMWMIWNVPLWVPIGLAALGSLPLRWRKSDRYRGIAWLVRDDRGELQVEVHAGGLTDLFSRHRYALIRPGRTAPLAPTGVALRQMYADRARTGGPRAYRLQLACDLPDGGFDLIAPLAVPEKGEPRAQFLVGLSRIRKLGQQLASHFKVPYTE